MALGYSISRRARTRKGVDAGIEAVGSLLNRANQGAAGIGQFAGSIYSKRAKPVPEKTVSRPTISPTGTVSIDNTPWSPTTPVAKTQGDFDTRVNNLAMQGLQPQLSAIDRAAATEEAAHKQRVADISNWWDWAAKRFNDAQSLGNQAIQGLNQNSQAVNSAAIQGVTDASRLQDAAMQSLASNLDAGGGAPSSESQDSLNATLAGIQNNQNFLSTTMGGLMAGAAEAAQLPAVGLPTMQADEALRSGGQLSDLSRQRSDVLSGLPSALEAARGQLNDQELSKAQFAETQKQNNRDYKLAKAQLGEQKANRLFQQYLASQELSLNKRKQSFDEWLQTQNVNLANRTLDSTIADQVEGRKIDWANVGLRQQEVNATLKGIRADAKDRKNAKRADRAKLKAGQFNTGLEVLNSYMAPGENELDPGQGMPDTSNMTAAEAAKWANKRPYSERTFAGAVRAMRQAGVGRDIIFQILKSSQNADWRRRAKEFSGLTKAKTPKQRKAAKDKIVKGTIKRTTSGPKFPPLQRRG